jgi:hypothetical protein
MTDEDPLHGNEEATLAPGEQPARVDPSSPEQAPAPAPRVRRSFGEWFWQRKELARRRAELASASPNAHQVELGIAYLELSDRVQQALVPMRRDVRPTVRRSLIEQGLRSADIAFDAGEGVDQLRASLARLTRARQSAYDGVARVLIGRAFRVVVLLGLCGGLAALAMLVLIPARADLAAGRPWTASSALAGYDASGVNPAGLAEAIFFCTVDQDSPWVRIDLGSAKSIDEVVVKNRSDCCAERAVPLAIEVSTNDREFAEVTRREDSFSTWNARFAKVDARYVRLRGLRKTYLHLRNVKVYAAKKSP